MMFDVSAMADALILALANAKSGEARSLAADYIERAYGEGYADAKAGR